ncbi:MAG: ABC transporter ATP-binding protein [Candidatus Bathyarchaeia archaeon]
MIEIRDLTYTYPRAESPAISHINLRIEEGEFVILTGPSGCGKTTLCRCLNGLIPNFYGGVINGSVSIAGLDTSAHRTNELSQHVGFVFQNPENQLFSLSAERDVAFGLENLATPRDEIRRRVDWALQVLGISNLRERSPQELSGGEQQKVALACVIAMKPKIMILDEPTSHLDPLSAKSILEVIGRLNREQRITVILVEQRLDLVAKYATRILVMLDGRIKSDGAPRTVLARSLKELECLDIPKFTRLHCILAQEKILTLPVSLSAEELSRKLRGALS